MDMVQWYAEMNLNKFFYFVAERIIFLVLELTSDVKERFVVAESRQNAEKLWQVTCQIKIFVHFSVHQTFLIQFVGSRHSAEFRHSKRMETFQTILVRK